MRSRRAQGARSLLENDRIEIPCVFCRVADPKIKRRAADGERHESRLVNTVIWLEEAKISVSHSRYNKYNYLIIITVIWYAFLPQIFSASIIARFLYSFHVGTM